MDCCVDCVEWVTLAREAMICGMICFICVGVYKIIARM
jgi:hypothetical protein